METIAVLFVSSWANKNLNKLPGLLNGNDYRFNGFQYTENIR